MSAIRKSIRQHFPLGPIFSKGSSNPITIHAVDDALFARVWSLVVESTVVEGELTRTTREAIAVMTSQRNSCPLCVTAHNMMKTATSNVEDPQDEITAQALIYAGAILDATRDGSFLDPVREEEIVSPAALGTSDLLTPKAKIETALAILTFQYLNRVVDALLGEELMSIMFAVPHVVARQLEKPSIMKYMNHLMKPLLLGSIKKRHITGLTEHLFTAAEKPDTLNLPDNLAGAIYGGDNVAFTAGRLCEWVRTSYQDHFHAIIPSAAIAYADDPANRPPADISHSQRMHWVSSNNHKRAAEMFGKNKKTCTMAKVLFNVRYSPKLLFNSALWIDCVKIVGVDNAKQCVMWYALRVSLEEARGF